MGDGRNKPVQAATSGGEDGFQIEAVEALLQLLGRARRTEAEARRETASGRIPAALTPEQLQEWFGRERYVVGEVLAAGGMATVYLAADLHLCRSVAYKMAHPTGSGTDASRFIYEAQVTAQLQHPSIIPISDCGIDPLTGRPFFTMPFVQGRTALDIVIGLRKKDRATRRLFGTFPARLSIFLKTCDAIAYAHAHDVIHRDVKPGNILVGEHGEVYVIDWGIAHAQARMPEPDPVTGRVQFHAERIASFHDIYHDGSRPPDSTFLGSPVHMAPEQFTDTDTVDRRADIYSLGCTLYELLALHPPFDPQAPLDQLLAAKRQAHFAPVSQYAPEVGPDVEAIIQRCLAPQRRQRYTSVRQLQAALQQVLHSTLSLRQQLLDLRRQVAGWPAHQLTTASRKRLLEAMDAILRADGQPLPRRTPPRRPSS